MPSYVIDAPAIPTLPVVGSDAVFPVRRVYCIGRNYAAHTIEMGGDPDREPPFFFQKNPDNLNTTGKFPYPVKSSDVHHEIEMVVALKSGGTSIPVDRALDPARPAGRGEGPAQALGDRQGIRGLRTMRPAGAGRENRSPGPRPDPAQGQR